MPPPALIAVDEDPNGLGNLKTQLLRRYGSDYRVECLGDHDEAVRTLAQLKKAGTDVALVLAGQADSGVTGAEFFERVRHFYPHAKRALLVYPSAWMDEQTAQAIRASMALGRIDYYLPRPSGERDEVFHEAVA